MEIDPVEKHLLERRQALDLYPPLEGNVPGMRLTHQELRNELRRQEDEQIRLYRESKLRRWT